MPVSNSKGQRSKSVIRLFKIMGILVIGVMLLSAMVFRDPVFVSAQSDFHELTSTPVPGDAEVTPEPSLSITQVTTPSPEEVGSTTGIIIWGTVLILILVAGTLRETLRRKGQ